ncbi:TPM domain-containing protein [Paenibacillus hexagrammi]|uniref:TPM domain-containing protein n=1 Tax=Paenibacillus hexagrammi TaxID=2908839 RepID=A0ABY3SJC3_9BACL|nr:TPM domain-containing protein [Paenibacillus sp. YPD9-1]UJF34139.1 TPM domain-containing protein [Paenibacillus sp. YPD9-1]
MKRMIVLLFVCWLLCIQIAEAAPSIDKQGLVQDLAGMFTQDEIAAIEKADQGNPHTFYVLTIDSLEGADSAAYATDVYNSWKLRQSDILLLISKQEHRVEMNFNNASLQKQLDANSGAGGSGSTAISHFIDQTFIPLAKEGKFADGVLTLMQQLEQLSSQVPASASTAPTASASVQTVQPAPQTPAHETVPVAPSMQPVPDTRITPTVPPAVDRIDMGQDVGSQGQPGLSGGGMYVLLVILAGMALAVLFMVGWLKKNRLKKLYNQYSALMLNIHHSHDQLQKYAGLVQGATEQRVQSLDKEITEWIVRLNETMTEMTGTNIFLLRFDRLNRAYDHYAAGLGRMEEAARSIKEGVQRIEEADEQSKKAMGDLNDGMPRLVMQLEGALKETAFPLSALIEDIEKLKELVGEADRLQLFDPLESERIAFQAKEAFEEASDGVSSIPRYLAAYSDFPGLAAVRRERIRHIALTRQIEKAILRLNPYALLERASEQMEAMYAELQKGAMRQVVRLAQEADNLLEQAVAIAERQAELKRQNQEDADRMQERLHAFTAEIQHIDKELERIRESFREHHLTELAVEWERARGHIDEAREGLPRILHLTHDEVQEFEQARRGLDDLTTKLNEADRIAQAMRESFRVLDERLERARGQFSRGQGTYQQALSSIRRESLIMYADWEQTKLAIEEAEGSLSRLLSRSPYHLDEMESLLEAHESRVNTFSSSVKRKIEEKHAAEQRMREAASRFHSMHARAGSRIHRGHYTGSYDQISQEAESLMARGLYAEAVTQLAIVGEIVDQMERDYQRVLDAEREEERRRQEEQQRMQQSQSSGGSSWDSGSTSSSGSDSSGNSSGGSNW